MSGGTGDVLNKRRLEEAGLRGSERRNGPVEQTGEAAAKLLKKLP